MKVYSILILLFSLIFLQQQSLQAQQNEKPVSIILIIANGMGIEQITAAMIANGDTLNLEKFPRMGLMKTWSTGNLNIDLKNGTVPIATGKPAFDEKLPDSIINKQKTILDLAKEKGKSVGFITTGEVTGNSIAPFYSHKPFQQEELLAKELVYSEISIFAGGGRKYFNVPGGTNYIDLLEKNDYKIVEDYMKLKKSISKKVAALVERNELKPAGKRGNYLEMAWHRAFKSLVHNKKGYLLVVENPHIEWAARHNDWQYMTTEIIEYDKLIGQIVNYVEPDNKTLVIVVCPYQIGGMVVTDGSLPDKHINSRWATKNTTPGMVPVFAIGPGADLFTGIYNNTDIFLKIKLLLE